MLASGAAACSENTGEANKSAGGSQPDREPIAQANDVVVEGDLVSTKEPDGGDGSGLIPDEIEDDIQAAQKAQASVKVAVVKDDSDQVVPKAATKQTTQTKAISAVKSALPSDPRIAMDINTAVPLQRIAWSQSPNYKACHDLDRPPYTMTADSKNHWCMNIVLPTTDAVVDVRYKIGGTREILHITSRVPFMGDNVLTCDILNNGDGQPVLNSKYVCEKSWQNVGENYGHGNNPKPLIVLKEKPKKTVTDPNEAQKLVKENCIDGGAKGKCNYDAATQKAYLQPSSEWRLYGDPQSNCNSKEAEDHIVKSKVEIAWEDRFGGKVGYEVKFIEVIKAGLEATYEHAITEARAFEEEHKGFVEYGTMHAFYVQPGMVHVAGDISIVTPYNVYSVPDQQFDIPLSKSWQPVQGRGQIVPRQNVHSTHVKLTCKNGMPSGDLPGFADRGVPEDALDGNGKEIDQDATKTSASVSKASS